MNSIHRFDTPLLSFAASIWAVLSSCGASAPSVELIDARRAFERAQRSEAEKLTPDELLAAHQALEEAEKAYQNDPGSAQERDLSYVAKRKSEIAVVHASTKAAREEQERIEDNYRSQLEKL